MYHDRYYLLARYVAMVRRHLCPSLNEMDDPKKVKDAESNLRSGDFPLPECQAEKVRRHWQCDENLREQVRVPILFCRNYLQPSAQE